MRNESNLPRARHPLSAICPDMNADVYASMLADMAATGYDADEPVIIFEGMVLDGWHRFTSGHSLGLPVPEKQFNGTLEQAKALVKRKLLHRDMTPSQRAMVEVEINGWRPRGGQNKSAPGADSPGLTEEQMAQEAGVGVRTIAQAKAVSRNAIPEVKDKVLSGGMSVKAAAQIATKTPKEQKRALAAPATPRKTPAWKAAADAPKPQVGASVEALNELKEKNGVLSEEVDRLTDRLAVLAAGENPTDEERMQYSVVLEELRAQVRALEAELDAVKAMRDKFQAENGELISQCRMYRNQLQKQRT